MMRGEFPRPGCKVQHTPGPWSYAADDMRDGHYSIYRNEPVAYCGDTTSVDGDGEANARLIAAAPDLLAACKASVEALTQHATFPADIDAALLWLRAAILKAEGGAK